MGEVQQQFPKMDAFTQQSDVILTRQELLDLCVSEGTPKCEVIQALLDDPDLAILALDYISKQQEQKKSHGLYKSPRQNSSGSSSPRNSWRDREQEIGVLHERWIVTLLLTAIGMYNLYKLVRGPIQISKEARTKQDDETKAKDEFNRKNGKDNTDSESVTKVPTGDDPLKIPVKVLFNVDITVAETQRNIPSEVNKNDNEDEKEEKLKFQKELVITFPKASPITHNDVVTDSANENRSNLSLNFNYSSHQEPRNPSRRSLFDYQASNLTLQSSNVVTNSRIVDAVDSMVSDEFGDDTYLASMPVSDLTPPKPYHLRTPSEEESFSAETTQMAMKDTDDMKDKALFNRSDSSGTCLENRYKRQKLNPISPDIYGVLQQEQSCYETSSSADKLFTQSYELLQHYFGCSSFRPGQYDAIQAVMRDKRDAALFVSSGNDEALCYQIPALLPSDKNADRNNIVVVVVPPCSQGRDHAKTLNALISSSDNGGDREVATCLGLMHRDISTEEKALQGYYNIIYISIEALKSTPFMDKLLLLHKTPNNPKRIVLFAFDFTPTDWTRAFYLRPYCQDIGKALREKYKQAINDIPMLAIIRRAGPILESDMLLLLQMKNDALKVRRSFDRPNLKIKVMKPPAGGLSDLLNDLVNEFKTISTSNKLHNPSTIVYFPTWKQADYIAEYLQKTMAHNGVKVVSYHERLPFVKQLDVSRHFVKGQSSIIIASNEFNMSISKPDIRNVVHYGCPKTLEEYYQQIGCAGQDGLPATCTMYVTEGTTQASESFESSMHTSRNLDNETCHRCRLLLYYNKIPSFGERCGTCDTCLAVMNTNKDSSDDDTFLTTMHMDDLTTPKASRNHSESTANDKELDHVVTIRSL